MKKWFVWLMLGLFAAMVILGCSHEPSIPSEPQYTVWTAESSYSVFQEIYELEFSDGETGIIKSVPKTPSDYSKRLEYFLSKASNSSNHSWTKSQMKDYLVGLGWDEVSATTDLDKFLSLEYGAIVSRRGNIVDYIIK